jgi:hypothetical protein
MKKIFTPLFSFTLLFIFLSTITNDIYAKSDFSYKKVKEFIPNGYQIYDTASGDFNGDGYTDFLIVLKSNNENPNSSEERPLLLLAGGAKGKLELVARNDHVVLCASCGGVFGDPYQKVSIKGEFLSVEHSVGGNWQWSRTITFKYNPQTKEIVLHEDITKSYQSYAQHKQKCIASNKTDFGNLPFTSYSYDKGFDR